jgi:hypothetical protein
MMGHNQHNKTIFGQEQQFGVAALSCEMALLGSIFEEAKILDSGSTCLPHAASSGHEHQTFPGAKFESHDSCHLYPSFISGPHVSNLACSQISLPLRAHVGASIGEADIHAVVT